MTNATVHITPSARGERPTPETIIAPVLLLLQDGDAVAIPTEPTWKPDQVREHVRELTNYIRSAIGVTVTIVPLPAQHFVQVLRRDDQ